MASWKVRLTPGDHEFRVEGEESVLESALRAGVSVGYGCRSGNCGDCRARVLSGEVRKIRPHDYVFNEAEKLAGYALMCSVTPASDLVIEMDVAASPDQIPLQQITTTVRGMERPNPQVLIMRLQTPRTRRLRFLAGQQVRLSMDDGSPSSTQPLANCPCDDRNLVLHLSADSRDPFITRCFDQVENGEQVEVEGPLGHFVLPDETPRPLLFLACNTGFAPVRSLVENVLAQEITEEIDLIWVADEATGHYQDNLCRSWQDAFDNVHFQSVDWTPGMDMDALSARLRTALAGIDDPARRHCFISGPGEFVRLARELALAMGILPDHQRVQEMPQATVNPG
ncbi:2Fe-2S iron-sulfur cluster-binding protein [Thioalkalivibrio thiocyanodenitrificans]|uniref:2Fe-2S iron-sulfur cluster-binding protein n=1 Tax=Thioalkalivibrio thiocyanodenitrificans TaxID=243063 RepID=UPI00036A9C1C|nr:2Fe-2S iron-sulfur cluster-binding protein [Thioalkalivibrio thiocyanodenitrificans]